MTVEELIAMLEMQEEILQFNHFTNEDAWELGNIMVAEARRRKMPVAISIRLNNGYTVFQYAGDGTNLHNENWLQQKIQYGENAGEEQPLHLHAASEE
ncbi:MAG: heme-binding protein [Blautia sp.]